MNPANASELRAALQRHGFRFSKSKGQNFLIDPSVPRRIAEASGADGGSFALEIGPGAGSLTVELAAGRQRSAPWSWTPPSSPCSMSPWRGWRM